MINLILFLFLILILILTYRIFINISKIESFDNKCNDFFNKNSYCEYDVENEKCRCKFQKDDVKYIFDSIDECCDNCSKLSKENCVNNKNYEKIPYYCNIGGECKEYNGTIINSHIAANNCGTDPLNNQILLPYESLNECLKTINPCDKYNISSRSKSSNIYECIKDVSCGFCTNDSGEGKCISGTAEGPLDLQNFYFCNPNSKTIANKYIYGDHSEYLLQS